VLLKNQHKLDLTATELLVLINLLSFWWYADALPFPRVATLAKRMNVTPRTVQRCLQKLVDKGLLAKKRDIGKDGMEREVLDPDGLVGTLKQMAMNDPTFEHRQHRMRVSDETACPF
jgi:predicted transcriptional regulator